MSLSSASSPAHAVSPASAALLTPPGTGGVHAIRLIGVDALERFKPHLRRRGTGWPTEMPLRVDVIDEAGDSIDDALLVVHAGFAELSIHGSMLIARQVMDLIAGAGIAIDDVPGIDAFDGASELQRVVMQAVPMAHTPLALEALLAQQPAWEGVASEPDASVEQLLHDRALYHLLHAPNIAIVGEANVGKSTLANHLFQTQRAIVADHPGTTRDWVGEYAIIDGLRVQLIDTPGQRATPDAVESAAQRVAQQQTHAADFIIELLDATHAPQWRCERPHLVAINKSDQPARWDADASALPISAKTGKGIRALTAAILRHFGCHEVTVQQPRFWRNEQFDALGAGQPVQSALFAGTERRA